MRRRLPSIAVLAMACFVAAGATDASAAPRTICVATPPATTPGPCDVTYPGVQAALNDAAATAADSDTVQIAAGSYSAPSGGFTYTDGGAAANSVRILGAGAGQTKLNGTATGPVLKVTSTSRSDVFDLSATPAGGFDNMGTISRSYGIQGIGNVLVEKVSIDAAPNAQYVVGVDTQGGLRSATITLPTASAQANVAAWVQGVTNGENVVDRSVLTAYLGVYMPATPVLVRRTRITAGTGVQTSSGSFTIESSSVRLVPVPAGIAHLGVFTNPIGPATTAAPTLRHVTIIGTGADSGGVQAVGSAGGTVSTTVDSSIVRNVGAAFSASANGGGTASITPKRSNFDPAGSTIPNPNDPSNINADPRFVDAANGDLRLLGGSPSIDTGAPDVAIGEVTLDLDTNPRKAGPATDMGAYEYQRRAPSVTASTSTPSVQAGQPASFSATASDPDPGENPSLSWSFDDGATASGATPSHAFAAPGDHTATVTATDPAGLTATASVRVTVTAPAGDGGTGPGGNGPGSSFPAITKLSLFPTAFLTSGKNAGAIVSYTLTKAGTVHFTVERATRGRRVGTSCVAATKKNRKAKPCTRYVALKGSIDRSAKAGLNTFRFTGKLGNATLAPGSYRLVATISKTVKRAGFTVKRAPRRRK